MPVLYVCEEEIVPIKEWQQIHKCNSYVFKHSSKWTALQVAKGTGFVGGQSLNPVSLDIFSRFLT